MQTIEIYKNYGVLGSEKISVYSFGGEHPHATCSDQLTVEVPKGWELYETVSGGLAVTAPWGWDYEINDVLAGDEYPHFIAVDKDGKERRFMLKIIK